MTDHPYDQQPAALPERPSLAGIENRWATAWESAGIYRFDRTAPRDRVFAIDTPPPTVSGALHVGHVFSYTHTDVLARYRRMRGDTVFYPMGFDDNGLATERRVQNHFGVRCEPSLTYDPGFAPPAEPPRDAVPISRRNFIDLCVRLTHEDERAFEALWRRLGLSVDWTITYRTIDSAARAAAQRAFLRELARGDAYSTLAPTLWDVSFRTAVAQAELEDRSMPGAFHRLAFRPDGATAAEPLLVDTTRPELLPACVALVAHPDDDRYRGLVGGHARTPGFGARVPILAHRLADPTKGTGLVMVCTFGDTTDVTWWRELQLPTRPVIGRDGRLLPDPPPGLDPDGERAYRERLAGATVPAARAAVIQLLRGCDALIGDPRPIEHSVAFYEKGDRPLEIVSTRQWYVRNGARDPRLRERLLARGRELRWHPEHLRRRYEDWVEGLTGDWLISRQRYHGVPIPVWYPLDDAGEPRYDAPIVPAEADLPVDPGTDPPPAQHPSRRGVPGGFVADPDVMDTWATSSLTPQIAAGWERDPDLFGRVFPMDLRPQAHEIIRTWLFTSVLRADREHGVLPWRNAVISGWILDPDRKKMSKSRGRAVTPDALLAEHGSDAVRYWAAGARPGVDTAFETRQMVIGRRLATKLLNASRFVLGLGEGAPDADRVERPDADRVERPDADRIEPLDAALLAALADVVRVATAALDDFDQARALAATETFFWTFCDDYLELVKDRAYGERGDVAAGRVRAVLRIALSTLLRLFAPVLPFVTEEVWSWWRPAGMPESVHRAPWPTVAELDAAGAAPGDPAVLAAAGLAVRAVRRAKSQAKVSMRTPAALVVARGPESLLAAVRAGADDLIAAGRIERLEFDVDDSCVEVTVDVRL